MTFRLFLSVLLLVSNSLLAQVQFNADSAYAYNRFLAEDIGPRPMGSRGEQQALFWAMNKFASFGADTAYIIPLTKTGAFNNTTSGTAVGVFSGTSDSIIVIGGHIDSDRSDNPGASDNASGTAVTVELARQWAKQDRRYTLVFAAFGAEEQGLLGSKRFVEVFSDIDKVALMFSIDMAASEGWLIPFIDMKTHQTPQWLIEDSYAVDRALGYNSLEYPTHFFSLNSAIGGAGSDHMPFMEKEIPAIDYTAGINIDPIHTLQDKFKFVKKPMLERSGKIVGTLLNKYQTNGIPAAKTGQYMLIEFLGGRIYLPKWLIIVINALAVVIGLLAWWNSRKQQEHDDHTPRIRFSAIKLFIIFLATISAMQFGEIIIQWIKGVRYPWAAHFDTYLFYAFIWAIGGLWAGIQLTRRWKLTKNAHSFASRAVLLYLVQIGLFAVLSARMALYPAIGLLLLGIAILLPGRFFKILPFFSPIPMMLLAFHEALTFLARSSMNAGFRMTSLTAELMFSLMIVGLLVFWFLPVPFALAYAFRALSPLRRAGLLFRSYPIGLILVIIIATLGGYVYSQSSYNARWQPEVRIVSHYNMNTATPKMEITSNEFLRGVSLQAGDIHRNYDIRQLTDSIPAPFQADWIDFLAPDSADTSGTDILWRITSKYPWYQVKLTLEADSSLLSGLESDLNFEVNGNTLTTQWSAEPPDTLSFAAKLPFPPPEAIIRNIEAIYIRSPIPVEAKSSIGSVTHRTTVTLSDTLSFSQ